MTRRTARLRAPADFGLALQQARLDRGLTQEQIAALLDLPQSTVSAMENGKSTIYLRRLLELADAQLYRAKSSGRNRTCLSEDPAPQPARTP